MKHIHVLVYIKKPPDTTCIRQKQEDEDEDEDEDEGEEEEEEEEEEFWLKLG